jgi:ABC-2 type transport system permease protein
MRLISFKQLFLANLRLIYRNYGGVFWTLVMPAGIYVALSVLPIGKIAGGTLSYSNYVLPGIIAMVIMQGGIYGLAYWMIDLKSKGVIKRLLVTPINRVELLLSLLASRVLVILVQVLVLTLVGVIFFHATFAGNYLSVVMFSLLGGFIFLMMGLFIASFASSYEAAAPITTAIGLPMTFLGNLFYPVDSLPKILQTVAKLLPVTYLADGMRKVYLAPFSWHDIGKDLIALLIWIVIALAIVLWRFRLEAE